MDTASLIASAFVPKVDLTTSKLVVCEILSSNESESDFTITSSLIDICTNADLGAIQSSKLIEIKAVAKKSTKRPNV